MPFKFIGRACGCWPWFQLKKMAAVAKLAKSNTVYWYLAACCTCQIVIARLGSEA